jgi:hypothetical protein
VKISCRGRRDFIFLLSDLSGLREELLFLPKFPDFKKAVRRRRWPLEFKNICATLGKMGIHQAFKFRLYPNADQRQALARQFGCSRFVYNSFPASGARTAITARWT